MTVSETAFSFSGGIMFETLTTFLSQSCPRYKGEFSEYAISSDCAFDSPGDELWYVELFSMELSDVFFPKNTNVLQHGVELGAKPLMDNQGRVELAWQTRQQDFVVLSTEFHLLSPEYKWWTYLSNVEFPVFQRYVMFRHSPDPKNHGKRMNQVVQYGTGLKSADDLYTPEV